VAVKNAYFDKCSLAELVAFSIYHVDGRKRWLFWKEKNDRYRAGIH